MHMLRHHADFYEDDDAVPWSTVMENLRREEYTMTGSFA